MSVRSTLWLLLMTIVLGPTKASGTIEAPPPLPDKALYARIAAIPESELTSDEMVSAHSDGVAYTMIYFRCARLELETAGACSWLTFDEQSETGVSIAGALQAIILGLRQGALPTHTDLFSRYGGTAALADMLLFDRTLQVDYAEMIAASDGETVLQQNFREDSLNGYQRLVEAEPSEGLDAVLKYVFHDYVVRGSDVAIIRLIELGPPAIGRFLEMHRSGMLAGETRTDLSLCGQPAAREYEALVVVLSFAGHPALSDVWAEPWHRLSDVCREHANATARFTWLYGVRTLNRVSLAVGANLAYRISMHEQARARAHAR
jgi:hypothetical protein